MIRQEEISAILDAQAEIFRKKENGLTREALAGVPAVPSFATIITGIRRCGKSTLLRQLMSRKYDQALYLNFEDIRLANFDADDFTRLLREIERRGIRVLFLDEIQIIPKWEIFIHQMLNAEYTIFISGSNASLLSRELGTHLTGRHIPMELFPFSYSEFLSFRNLPAGEDSLSAYLHDGGIPEYVKYHAEIILNTLIDDILIRDIAIRNSIKDVNSLRALAVYLLSNVGNLVSAETDRDVRYKGNVYLLGLLLVLSKFLSAGVRAHLQLFAEGASSESEKSICHGLRVGERSCGQLLGRYRA